jgi:TldD protein
LGKRRRVFFLNTNRSWSIDDKRINFQFGTEIGWEIKNGKLGEMVKSDVYRNYPPSEFCDAIANRDHWQMWNAQLWKRRTGQVAHVGHGHLARFRMFR